VTMAADRRADMSRKSSAGFRVSEHPGDNLFRNRYKRAVDFTALFHLLLICLLALSGAVYAQETGANEAGSQVTELDAVDTGEPSALQRAEYADSLWRRWMEVDADGVRTYWFRRSFEIQDPPAGGKIWLTADDDYSLYLNGEYIASDETEGLDWMNIREHDIGDYLVIGRNIIAVQVDDVDDTRHGLLFGMTYETIPEIETQLDRIVQRELDAQEERRLEHIRQQEAAKALRESRREPPSVGELRDMRVIEKNKLE